MANHQMPINLLVKDTLKAVRIMEMVLFMMAN